MYRLSRTSGVAYTVINELINQKRWINDRPLETIVKLALVLGTSTDALADPFPVMDHVSGTYRKIRYRWEHRDTMYFHFYDGREEHIVDTGYHLTDPAKKAYYTIIGEFLIDDYLEEKEFLMKTQRLMEP